MKMIWFKGLLAEEKGAVLIIVAMGMAVFLGFTAMVADIGLLYLTRASLANSADAAVLAGVQELPNSVTKAKQEAEKYLSQNNPGDEYNVIISNNNYQIEVVVNGDVKLLFAQFLGFDSAMTGASSTAAVGALSGYKGIMPFGITEQTLNFGMQYQFKQGSGEGESGTYGALALGGTGAALYGDNIKFGFPQMVKIGDVLPIKSGNMDGPTKQGVGWRISQCDHGVMCAVNNPVPGCPRILMMPVYKPHAWEQNKLKEVQVVGFAAFYIEKLFNNGEIKGKFLRMVVPGEVKFGTGGNDYGVMAARLIK